MLLTVFEAAKELRISLALCYGLIAARKIRHERHGLGRGRILIPSDALDEYRDGVTIDVGASRPSPRAKGQKIGQFTELDPEKLQRAWEGS